MSDNNNSYDRPERKPKKRHGHKVDFFFLFVIVVAACVWAFLDWLPNSEEIAFRDYNTELAAGIIYPVINDEYLTGYDEAIYQDDMLYLPFDLVHEYFDTYLFWDAAAEQLIITTADSVMRLSTQSAEYTINDRPAELSTPLLAANSTVYLSEDLLRSLYPQVDFAYLADTGFVQITLPDTTIETYAVNSEKVVMRYEPDKKSPIASQLELNQQLTVYYTQEDYSRVSLENGYSGWVLTAKLDYVGTATTDPAIEQGAKTPIYTADNGKINLLWDQVFNTDATSDPNRKLDYDGLDVISPTWFSFDEETLDGTIVSIAVESYVKRAHALGLQVWALITDNFKGDVSHAVLSSTETRKYVIDQLFELMDTYGLDGINIDFEMVREEDAGYYIQFLRELAPLMTERGKVLSVDMYVPMAYNLYYNRTEVAKCADYIIIMGYDEHYSTSPVSGPVASINFVEGGIADTMNEAPKENIILGMPYFVRVWREIEENGEVSVSSSAYSMDKAYSIFTEQGAEFTWDDDVKSYYAEYEAEEDGVTVTYKVWLEDLTSIEEKLKLVAKYDVAGVAGWKKGLESEGMWALLKAYLKKQ